MDLSKILPRKAVQSTYLPPHEEVKYRAWLKDIGQTPNSGYAIDETWTGTDYDYRGHFKKYGPIDIKNGQHFTDEFKLPNHRTFSDESIYATGDDAKLAGTWVGDTYVPSALGIAMGKRVLQEGLGPTLK